MILKEQNKTDGNHRTSDLELNVFLASAWIISVNY